LTGNDRLPQARDGLEIFGEREGSGAVLDGVAEPLLGRLGEADAGADDQPAACLVELLAQSRVEP
jgi:hypothetical protein